MIRIIPLAISFLFTGLSNAQQPKLKSDNTGDKQTLKAFDFRGQGYDASIDYALLNSSKLFSVVVDVQTRKSDSLVKLTGKAMKELDAKGCKDMALLASDKDTSKAHTLESVYIYVLGSVYGVLSKGLSDDRTELWFYYNKERKLILQEYPKNFNAGCYIKSRIIEAYKSTGRNGVKN